jgi:ATP-dependent Clp protease ATP-binding subunit ClpA
LMKWSSSTGHCRKRKFKPSTNPGSAKAKCSIRNRLRRTEAEDMQVRPSQNRNNIPVRSLRSFGKQQIVHGQGAFGHYATYFFLRLDANQFSDRESTWTLLGSPKGYVGSDKPGLLPYAISQNPKLVLLIDEIEKADQGFYQFLLQMLDEGYVIERSTGGAYYLQRAIVIITSNLENKRIAEIMETLSDPVEIDIAVRKTLEGAKINLGGGRTFRITPEFLGRIDAVVPFRSLGFEDLVQIAYREIRGLGVDISYERARELTQKYYLIAKEYGVRYFLKKIQEDVLTQ